MPDLTKEDPDKGMIRVFVYGTLKKPHGNNRLLKNDKALFLGYDTISGPYRMYNMGGFPATMDAINKPQATIYGELWAVSPEGLASLDLLEGNPTFFSRRKLWTDNLEKRAWVYFLNETWADEVTDDDFVPGFIWRPGDEEKAHWGILSDGDEG